VLGLLDTITRFLVGISVRDLVFTTTVNLDLTALTPKKMFRAAADWAARGEGEAHCVKAFR
jgi:hypothetical protein